MPLDTTGIGGLGSLSWDEENVQDSLNHLFNAVREHAVGAALWYTSRRQRSMRRAARGIRSLSLFLATLAGLMPMVSQLMQSTLGKDEVLPIWFQPVWSSVFLAIGGALILVDKFYGFSSSWVRFATTSMAIEHAERAFVLDWETERAGWAGATPTTEQVESMFGRARAMLTRVDQLVEKETELWKQEFQSALALLDKKLESSGEADRARGGLQVTLTNAAQLDDAWKLALDEGHVSRHTGSNAAVSNVAAGLHTIRIEGSVGGKALSAEHAIKVEADQITSIELSLE